MKKRFSLAIGLLVSTAMLVSACGSTKPTDTKGNSPATSDKQVESKVNVTHYFSGDLGQKAFDNILAKFEAASSGVKVVNNPMEHEAFKSSILVQLAGSTPPDTFSYWAGAKTQFLVDTGSLQPIDDIWQANKLDEVFPKGLTDAASTYGGKKYLIPVDYHYVGLFYNPATLKKVGVTETPKTWDEFLALCEKLKAAGIHPIAVGSKNRWPAQFWFDYLILRTAGPEYRAKLMAGQASYTDAEVQKAMQMWADLAAKGYFAPNANAFDWTDAADMVAKGEAGMTLMGTWITGYWDGNKLKAGTDYDFFPFPVIDPKVKVAALGPVDGFVISAKAPNAAGAKNLLVHLTKPEVQAEWAKSQGALAPSTKVNPSEYSVVMQKATKVVAESEAFAFNYDLATPPAVSDIGLNMFAQFMDNPSKYQDYLKQTQTAAVEAFKQK